MTDDEFKKHLYKLMEEDKKNQGVLTHRLYNKQNAQNKPTISKKTKTKSN